MSTNDTTTPLWDQRGPVWDLPPEQAKRYWEWIRLQLVNDFSPCPTEDSFRGDAIRKVLMDEIFEQRQHWGEPFHMPLLVWCPRCGASRLQHCLGAKGQPLGGDQHIHTFDDSRKWVHPQRVTYASRELVTQFLAMDSTTTPTQPTRRQVVQLELEDVARKHEDPLTKVAEADKAAKRAVEERSQAILDAFAAGWALQDIADTLGVTHEAVRKIVRAAGL